MADIPFHCGVTEGDAGERQCGEHVVMGGEQSGRGGECPIVECSTRLRSSFLVVGPLTRVCFSA